MTYACRSLPHDISPQDLETKLNDAATRGWTCTAVLQRSSDLLVVFSAEFSNIGDREIATSMLDASI